LCTTGSQALCRRSRGPRSKAQRDQVPRPYGRVARLSNRRSHHSCGCPVLRVLCEGRVRRRHAQRAVYNRQELRRQHRRPPLRQAQGRLLQKTQGWGTLRGNGAMQRWATRLPSSAGLMWPRFAVGEGWGGSRPRIPYQGHRDDAAIPQTHAERVVRGLHVENSLIGRRCRKTQSMPGSCKGRPWRPP
jgi:hypothetical protein